MALFEYPDLTREIPESRDFIRGHTEHRLREAMQDFIRDCASGNRLIGRGQLYDLADEVTEVGRG